MDTADFAIEFSNVTKCYGPTFALRNLTLRVPPGEVWALTGNNGCGKSTIVRLAAGLIQPTEGEVCVLGRHPDGRGMEMDPSVAYIPQGASFSKALTVRDIVRFAAHRKNLAIASEEEVLAMMGIAAAADWLVGLLPQHVVKRLALAVAFMSDPTLMLLDEPTMSLDREGRDILRRYLEESKGKRTVLLSTPFLGPLEPAVDVVVDLDNGEVTRLRRLYHQPAMAPPFHCLDAACEDESEQLAIIPVMIS